MLLWTYRQIVRYLTRDGSSTASVERKRDTMYEQIIGSTHPTPADVLTDGRRLGSLAAVDVWNVADDAAAEYGMLLSAEEGSLASAAHAAAVVATFRTFLLTAGIHPAHVADEVDSISRELAGEAERIACKGYVGAQVIADAVQPVIYYRLREYV